MSLASFFNLGGPDLLIIAVILVVLALPVAFVVVIVRHVSGRSTRSNPKSEPPPLPKEP